MFFRELHSFRLLAFFLGTLVSPWIAANEAEPAKTNKLLYMYRFYYLPFSIEFKEGKTNNDILPYVRDANSGALRLIKADELQAVDTEWGNIREPWRSKSLLLTTPVPIGENVRITTRLSSHRIPLNRTALDGFSLNDRIQVGEGLKGKSREEQVELRQYLFLRSFLNKMDDGRFNFFMVSASWCESCREYRLLLEAYFKNFPKEQGLNFHSVVIEDPREEIFEKPILKELFPNPKKYSHESIPRFLALEVVDGKSIVLEEGDALKALYERYFEKHRGYLDKKVRLPGQEPLAKPAAEPQRGLSSIRK